MESEVLSVEDVAKFLKVNKVTVRRWIRIGQLKATKIGLKWFINREDLKETLSGLPDPRQDI